MREGVKVFKYGGSLRPEGGGFTALCITARLAAAGPLMCVLWFGARQVIEGKLTAGQLSAFVVYAVFVSGNVGSLAGVFSSLIQVLPRAPALHPLLTL